MSNYIYQAVDGQGIFFNGSLKAENKKEAAQYLFQQGLFILKLERDYLRSLRRYFHDDYDERELIMVCRQLAVMIKAGVPLGSAIQLINQSRRKRQSVNNDKMTAVLQEVYVKLQGGSSFSDALAEAGEEIFPKPMIAAVAAGEAGGILEEILARETESISRNYQAKNKLKTAMIYPVFLICTAIVLIAIMLTVVFPVFTSLFNNMNVVLPLPTRIVLGINDFIQAYSGIILLSGMLLLFIGGWLWQKESYQLRFYEWLLKTPVIGRLLICLELQRWLETLSLLLSSGIVIIDAIKISAEVFSNKYLKAKIKGFENRLRRGETLSQVSRSIITIDDYVIELIRAGEISGELPEMLSEGAVLCSMEADTLLKKVEAMAEPTIIIFIGVVTGFLVISILMPIMEMMTLYS